MVRKVPPIGPLASRTVPLLPPNRRSKKPPCWPASAAERYCEPQPLSPSAISSDCRWAARSVVPPWSCSRSFCMRSRRVALLVDLAVERAALRRRVAEDREEAGAFAAHAARLRHQPVDLELLAVDRVFGAANLVGAGRIVIAAVERGELGFQPLAGRVRRGCCASATAQRREGRHAAAAAERDFEYAASILHGAAL